MTSLSDKHKIYGEQQMMERDNSVLDKENNVKSKNRVLYIER